MEERKNVSTMTCEEIIQSEKGEVDALLSKLEKPATVLPERETEATEEYLRLAMRAGIRGKIFYDAVHHAFRKHEIVVYPQLAVSRYLDGICEGLTKIVTKDDRHPRDWGFDGTAGVQWSWLSVENYDDTIPVEALRVMDRANSALDDIGISREGLTWAVSKVTSYPDPFLALYTGSRLYVLYHWDEPGFSILK